MNRRSRLVACVRLGLVALVGGASFADAGEPRRAAVVAPSPVVIPVVPVVTFFRVGEAAREAAIRDEAYRAGYARGREDESRSRDQTGAPTASRESSLDRDSQRPAASPGDESPRETIAEDAAFGAASAVLKRSCVRCHSGDRAAGDVDLADANEVAARRVAIFKQAYTGRMPPSGPALSDDDVRVLLEFLIADESPAAR